MNGAPPSVGSEGVARPPREKILKSKNKKQKTKYFFLNLIERNDMKKSKGYKVVLNSQFGGFGLSKEAVQMLNDRFDLDIDSEYGYVDNDDFGIKDENYEAYRMDHRLISVVEDLGMDKASGSHAALRVVDVPDEVVDVHGWHISDYDGCESIHQTHWVA